MLRTDGQNKGARASNDAVLVVAVKIGQIKIGEGAAAVGELNGQTIDDRACCHHLVTAFLHRAAGIVRPISRHIDHPPQAAHGRAGEQAVRGFCGTGD